MDRSVTDLAAPALASRSGPSSPPSLRRRLADWAVIGLFVIAAFTVMRVMAGLLVPMTAAIVIGSILARVGDRAAAVGAPPLLVGLGLGILTVGGGVLLVDALLDPFLAMVAEAPRMLGTLSTAAAPLLEPVSSLKRALLHLDGQSAAAEVTLSNGASGWLTDFVSRLTPALGEFFVFFATLAFFIAGRMALRRQMILVWGGRQRRLAAVRMIHAIENALVRYFATTATIYAAVGLATAVIAAAFGLANPLLWGTLAFTASFIPYLGAGVIMLALAAGGLTVHPQLLWALMPAAAFLIVHLVSENAVIPALLGRRLELNPFVVFVAILFWGWMWGPVGTMLAVPLLLIADTIRCQLRPIRGALPD